MKKSSTRLMQLFHDNKLTIALAESMTCGLAAYELSVVPNTSEVLKGGIVCYHETAKTEVLSVSKNLIKKHTTESQQVTDAMAKKLSRILSADVYAAITGLASPGGSESSTKPVGTVFFAVMYKDRLYRQRNQFRGTPTAIRKRACVEMYEFILSILKLKKNRRSLQ